MKTLDAQMCALESLTARLRPEYREMPGLSSAVLVWLVVNEYT
jgi:hypothetical protein